MNINLKEIMEQLRQAENRGKKQEPEISVTIKEEGKEDVTYKEHFLVMHMDEGGGRVVGCLGVVDLISAVEMLLDSVTKVIKDMPPHKQMIVSRMLLNCIKERMEDEG